MIREEEDNGVFGQSRVIQFLQDRAHHVVGASYGSGVGRQMPADLRNVGQTRIQSHLGGSVSPGGLRPLVVAVVRMSSLRAGDGEGVMRIVGACHQEEGLVGGLGGGKEVPGKAAVNFRVPPPEILVAFALPGVGHRPAEEFLLVEGLADGAAEEPGFVQKGRQGGGAGADALESLRPVVLGIQPGQHHTAGGCADGDVDVGLPELHALLRQLVEVGCDPLGHATEASRRVPVHVVCHQPEDVGTDGWMPELLGGQQAREQEAGGEGEEGRVHDVWDRTG